MKTPFLLSFLLLGIQSFAQEQTAPPLTVDAAKFPSLQAAVDALPAAGGLVQLPPGRFELKEPLVIRTGETRLEGAGAATLLVNVNQEGKPALHLRPDAFATDRRVRLWRVQLGNFRLSGNEKSGDGVLAEGIDEIFIQGLSVDHHGGNGIHLVRCYEDPRIADSILTYNKQAGLQVVEGHDIVVNANHFEENLDGLVCLDSFNLTANGNNLDDHLRHGIVIENTYGSVVSGNMIEECQGIAIILDRDCYGITLSANVIAHDLQGGIDLRDAWGCAVSANTFTLVHGFGVRAGPESGRLAISANVFGNSYIGNGQHKRLKESPKREQIDAGTGVVLENAEDIVVSGNLFAGLDGKAVTLEGECPGVLIQGNGVTDVGRRETVDRPLDGPAEANGLR